jgi:hypothetical protein
MNRCLRSDDMRHDSVPRINPAIVTRHHSPRHAALNRAGRPRAFPEQLSPRAARSSAPAGRNVRCCQRRDAAHAGVVYRQKTQPSAATGRRRRALPRSSVSRLSPRLRVVPRGHHEVGAVGAALRAAKPQLGQRHVTAPGLHDRLQVGGGLVATRVAEHQHADIAGAQRGTRCPQRVELLTLT